MKSKIINYIGENSKSYCQIADTIFDKPELGYQEYFACDLLTKWLAENGYEVEKGCFGVETAFRAVYENGEGGPSIGLLCEYDALPMGHACGHHMQGPIMFLAAEAIKHTIADIPYKLVIYGTPAEEGGNGKLKMLEGGAFNDIDLSLMTHGSPYTTVDVKALTGVNWSFEFTGVAAHESLTPELVRSALDGMLVAFNGLEFLRGHVKEDVKFMYTINECAGTPNSKNNITAKGKVNIRTYQDEDMPELERRMQDVFNGAALITGTKVELKKTSMTKGKLPSYSLNKIIMDNAKALDAPQILEVRERTGGTDFGFVTHEMPGAVSRFSFVPEGTTSHSQTFLDYGKREEAHQGIVLSARIIACSVYDLISNQETLQAVKDEFTQRKSIQG